MSNALTDEQARRCLQYAILGGDLAEVQALQAAGAVLSPGGLPPADQAKWLQSAIKAPAHQAELLDLLLAAGFDPSSVDDSLGEDYQSTPLTAAARAGRLDLVERLAAAGADLHWRSPTGANAASVCLPSRAGQDRLPDSGSLQSVRAWLDERGVRLDPDCRDSRRKLVWASYAPVSWPDIPRLLELGIDPEVPGWTPFQWRLASGEATEKDAKSIPDTELAHRDRLQRTPFLMAVEAGRRDLAGILLARGSDLHARGWCGATALHLAAASSRNDLLEWLVTSGLPVDVPDDFRQSPLRRVLSPARIGTARHLLTLGADIHQKGVNGFSVIADAHSRPVIELLLEHGADVNTVSRGDWPLANACSSGDADFVRFLLSRGAKPDLTSTGETALHRAVMADSLECVALLLGAGAEINATDVDGSTCLWWVKSAAMARYLLANGADPGIADEPCLPGMGSFPETAILPLEVSALFREHRLNARR